MAVYVEAPGRWRWSSAASDQAAQVFSSTELVELKLVSAGICGTDLSVLAGTNPLARYPLVLGHVDRSQFGGHGVRVARSFGRHGYGFDTPPIY